MCFHLSSDSKTSSSDKRSINIRTYLINFALSIKCRNAVRSVVIYSLFVVVPIVCIWGGGWLLYVMFSCIFVTFLCVVLGQMWHLIVSILDLCLLPYFVLGPCSVMLF